MKFILDRYTTDATTAEIDPSALSPSTLALLVLARHPEAIAYVAQHPDVLTAAGEWNEEDHPRDERGRFGDKGGGDSKPAVFITRQGPDEDVLHRDEPGQHFAERRADDWIAEDGEYEFADDWNYRADLTEEQRDALIANEHIGEFEPGSVEALSESVTQWQGTFERAEQITAAADQLLGHGPRDTRAYESGFFAPGGYKDEDAAYAREILSAMSGHGPDGAATGGFQALPFEDDNRDNYVNLREFGPDEPLFRGVVDADGALTDAFSEAYESGGTVSWSMASFTPGGPYADRRADLMEDEYGEPRHHVPDGEGGERPQTGEEVAADFALDFATVYHGGAEQGSPVLIMATGTALNIDGAYEAVMGGTFEVNSIRNATRHEQETWGYDQAAHMGAPVRVVQISQVANVDYDPTERKEPAVAAAAGVPQQFWLTWTGGSYAPAAPRARTAAGDYDEGEHPRGPDGRFISKGGDTDPDDEAEQVPLPGVGDGRVGHPQINEARNERILERALPYRASINGMDVATYEDRANEHVADIINAKEIVVRADAEDVYEILHDGEFQNQFETQTSNGWFDSEHGLRRSTEDHLYGVERDAGPEDRPIYGYLRDAPGSGPIVADSASQYGEVMFTFDRDVRDRTSWTESDSLGSSDAQTVGDVGAPSMLGLELAVEGYTEPLTWHPSSRGPYIEAQIHGGLGTDQITGAYFDSWAQADEVEQAANDDAYADEKGMTTIAEAANALAADGIPVYGIADDSGEGGFRLLHLDATRKEPIAAAGDFDEEKHPRDDAGRFAETEGGDSTYDDRYSGGGEGVPVNEATNRKLLDAYMPQVDEWAAAHNMSRDEYLDAVDARVAEAINEREIVVRVGTDTVPEIVADGELQNQFETHTSSGIFDAANETRRQFEDERFGIERDVGAEGRPIYGYLRPDPKDTEASSRFDDEAKMYGDVMLVLDPAVRDRATWTERDSFAPSMSVGRVNDPNMMGLQIDEHRDDPLTWEPGGSSYNETQIHGGVGTDDIAAAYIDRFNTRMFEKAIGGEYPTIADTETFDNALAAVDALSGQGIPVYAVNRETGKYEQIDTEKNR